MSRLQTIVVAWVITALTCPAMAVACPVCFQATDDNRWAFIATTGFLTFLPLLLIGASIVWVKQQYAALELLEAEAAPSAK